MRTENPRLAESERSTLTFRFENSIPGTLNETATVANLTQLTGALNTYAPGALQMLEAIRGITVFAPVNAAFANVTDLLSTLNATQITDVLLKSVPELSAARVSTRSALTLFLQPRDQRNRRLLDRDHADDERYLGCRPDLHLHVGR